VGSNKTQNIDVNLWFVVLMESCRVLSAQHTVAKLENL